MGRHNKFTVAEIETELVKTCGAIALAAQNLNTQYNTVKRYVDSSPALQAIVQHYRERRVDTAELKLEQAIMEGQPWAVAMTLKTLGRSRGYGDAVEHTGEAGGPIKLVVEYVNRREG